MAIECVAAKDCTWMHPSKAPSPKKQKKNKNMIQTEHITVPAECLPQNEGYSNIYRCAVQWFVNRQLLLYINPSEAALMLEAIF